MRNCFTLLHANNCVGYENYHYFNLYLWWVFVGTAMYCGLSMHYIGWGLLEIDTYQQWYIFIG